MIRPGQQSPETRAFGEASRLPALHEVIPGLAESPLNLSFLLALGVAFAFWLYVWHMPGGYGLRVVGQSERAAVYAGIDPKAAVVRAMVISGALAGLVGINELMAVQQRLMIGFVGGFGYVGIAVALMGRNHPVGIVLSAILFGALFQGGTELAFEIPAMSRDLVVAVQGLVILFCGAFDGFFRGALRRLAGA
ncbi:MAG: hypothetical protein OHK0024_21810 [Thalassobaculales bacterium]